MKINISYQLVLFSDCSNLIGDPQLIERIQKEIVEFNMGIKPMVEVVIDQTGVHNKSCPCYVSHDQVFSLVINSDRMTFKAVNVDIDVVKMCSMAEFLNRVYEIGDKTSIISSRLFNRVGLIRTTFFENVDLVTVFKFFSNHIKYYDNLEMLDWNFFFPARVHLSDGTEINATSRISHANVMVHRNSMSQKFDGISLVTDVNTVVQNRGDSISWDSVKALIEKLQKNEYDIRNQTANVIEGS